MSKIFHAPMVDYLNSYCTDIVGGGKSSITGYDESLNWGAGRSKMAWWNLIMGFHSQNLIPNSGTPDNTDWVDTNLDGIADDWAVLGNGTPSIITGNGFNGNAQKFIQIDAGVSIYIKPVAIDMVIGDEFILILKSRSNNGIIITNGITVVSIPSNTGNAVQGEYHFTAEATGAVAVRIRPGAIASDWFEIDEFRIQHQTAIAQQPANDAGSIPGLNIAVTNPSKCNPFVPIPFLFAMLDFTFSNNLINMLTMM